MKATGPGQSTLLLGSIVPIINSLKINYAVIGALAAAYYGSVRASLDADILVSIGGESELRDKLIEKMREHGFFVEVREPDLFDPIAGVIVVNDEFENRVDILLGIRGIDRAAFERTVENELLGIKLKIIGLEDFIAMKLFASGVHDLEDAKAAFICSKEKVNSTLLKHVAANYGPEVMAALEKIILDSSKAV